MNYKCSEEDTEYFYRWYVSKYIYYDLGSFITGLYLIYLILLAHLRKLIAI